MLENNKEIHEKAQVLLDAAYDYWKACQKEGLHGAIQWLDDTSGKTVVFTRGEYRGQLLHNIDALRGEASLNTVNLNTPQLVDDYKEDLDQP